MTAFFAAALIEEIPVVLLSFFEVRNKTTTVVVVWRVVLLDSNSLPHGFDLQSWTVFALCFVLRDGLAHVARESFPKWVRGYLMRSASRKRMKYRHKMLIMLSMLIAQVLVHSYAMWDLVTQKYEDHHQDSIPVIALHGAIFLYFMTLFGIMIHDVYCNNFIMTSIGKKKIIYNISWKTRRSITRSCT